MPRLRLWGLCALLVGAGCSLQGLQSVMPGGGQISVDEEKEMTAEIHRQIRAQAELVVDPLVLAFVNEIGQRIVRSTRPQPFIYRFSILRSDELNAFTIGGGYVYISSEVLAQAGDVTELAGVLAHEVAHVRLRHIARAQENQGLVTLASLAAALAVAVAGGDPALLMVAEGINVSLQLKNSREHEAEADRAGLDYLVRSGYSPRGMARFFERILAVHPHAGDEIPAYLYSHPALRERIAAARVSIERTELPPGLMENDARLAQIQTRLALVLSSLAGGSGLQARADFDREASDPLLEQAAAEREQGDSEAADRTLARAQLLQPNDPRLALARADLAMMRGDLPAARTQLERAIEIDPSVPLVQYRLGLLYKRIGNLSRAVFYLEQAATNFSPRSSRRRTAELEIQGLSFNLLDSSGLGTHFDDEVRSVFSTGERILWWGRISSHFHSLNPRIRVHWTDPQERVVLEEPLRMSPLGRVSSSLPSPKAGIGSWTVTVHMGETIVETHTFRVTDGPTGPSGDD